MRKLVKLTKDVAIIVIAIPVWAMMLWERKRT